MDFRAFRVFFSLTHLREIVFHHRSLIHLHPSLSLSGPPSMSSSLSSSSRFCHIVAVVDATVAVDVMSIGERHVALLSSLVAKREQRKRERERAAASLWP